MNVMNYHRFYASLNRLTGVDREDMKETLVSSFTDGRTTHLHEMTQKEYNALCASLEERTGWKGELRRKRSLCLKLMQKAGVDTSDWTRINNFCQNPKIAGRVFAQLGVKDLDALQVKLRAIIGRGGLKPAKQREVAMAIPEQSSPTRSLLQHTEPQMVVVQMPLVGMGEA